MNDKQEYHIFISFMANKIIILKYKDYNIIIVTEGLHKEEEEFSIIVG